MYGKRNEILDSESIHETVLNSIHNHVTDLVKSRNVDSHITDEELQSITDFANENLLKNDISKVELENRDADDIIEYLYEKS